jgi:hypothetical protein
VRTQAKEFAEEEKTKVELLGAFEILPSMGRRSAQAQESTTTIGSVEQRDLDR